MKDKKELAAIAELANEVAYICPNLVENWCTNGNCVDCLTTKIYENGYRKVVRCKDCKYSGILYCSSLCQHPKALLSKITDDDFCSYGERREK